MYESGQTSTVAIKPCRTCRAGLLEESKFCRSCGAPQTQTVTASYLLATPTGDPEHRPPRKYETAKLSQDKLYHPVSGPLVKAVAAGVPANAARSPGSTVTKRVLLALMAIPIWVMIILLSPLDAYASAKIIGSRI